MPQTQKEERQEMMNRLAKCFGAESGEKVGSSCSGKWAGTTDYSVKFNNGVKMFISNGMKHFDNILAERVAAYENFGLNKDVVIDKLRTLEATDNEKAAEMGMKQYHIKDIRCTQSGDYMGWFYGVIEVDGKETTISETGLHYAIFNSFAKDSVEPLKEYIDEVNEKNYFVAGGLKEADFVFHGVGFDTQSPMYKGHGDEEQTVFYKCYIPQEQHTEKKTDIERE